MEAKKVLGQDHITKYFINAIVSNKISHAYIIEGPQGSGKEELAREFATALVCESEDVKSTGEPCYIGTLSILSTTKKQWVLT